MEAIIVQEFLNHESFGWIGWVSLLLLAITIVLGLLSKSILAIVTNIKSIQSTLKVEKKDYRQELKKEADVTGILRTIRHDLFADRVLVLQYHNGIHSIAQNHLWKVSATHEVISKNAHSMINAIQSWPSNYLGEWNGALFDSKYIELKEKVSMEECPGLRGVCEFLAAYEVDRMILFPIVDSYGEVFGVGMVHMANKSAYPTPDMIKWASQRFYAVGALLAGVKE
jgi:uncharacterized protein involved in tolerance to divalent cations